MSGVLEDLFVTRTDHARDGNIGDEWNHTLLWRDLYRLIAESAVETIDWPLPVDGDSRERKFFRDLGTNEIYVYVGHGERNGPQFRKLREGDTPSLKSGTQSIQ
jgi:hypothetical protein